MGISQAVHPSPRDIIHGHVTNSRTRRSFVIHDEPECVISCAKQARMNASFVLTQVSWVRRRDWHIISSGTIVYTADSRFSVLNRPGSPDWILMLKSPQLHDSGTYECQVSRELLTTRQDVSSFTR